MVEHLQDKVERILAVKNLNEQGIKPWKIAEELGIGIQTVYRNIKYADDLALSDLTAREIASKRQEIYLETYEMAAKAKKAFEEALSKENSIAAKRYFDAWMDAAKLRTKLYGVIIDKPDQYFQINMNQNKEEEVPAILNEDLRKELSEKIKQEHERKMRQTYETKKGEDGVYSTAGTTASLS